VCRALHEGGRRCAGCQGTKALEAHNRRRRENRKIRKDVLAWAGEQKLPVEVLESLQRKPVDKLKAMARELGAPSGMLQGGRNTANQAPRQKPENTKCPLWRSSDRWVTPQLQERINNVLKLQGGHGDERELLESIPRKSLPVAAGVNTTNCVSFGSEGMKGFHKPFGGVDQNCARAYGQSDRVQPIHEFAAWHMARNLGERWEKLVPPCVLREIDGQMGSISYGVPGWEGYKKRASDDLKDDAAFFDALIGQQDRHRGNYLGGHNTLHLIDHGFSFARPGDVRNVNHFLAERTDSGRHFLKDHETAALRKLLDSPNSFGLDGVLEPERVDAMRKRAQRMLETGTLLRFGDF
jgi:hypothetical protein